MTVGKLLYFKLKYNSTVQKLLLILILSFFSAQSFAGSCPDGSDPVKSISADGTYFVYNCGNSSNDGSVETNYSDTTSTSSVNCGNFVYNRKENFEVDSNISHTSHSNNEVENYFYEIALGAEYGSDDVTIQKWTSDINIYCDGEWNNELLRELDTIINDLTPLMGSVKINVVKQKHASNFIAYIGHPTIYYKTIEPSSQPYVYMNDAMFWIYWTNQKHIYKGSMWVDSTLSVMKQRALLREELTQSLGLMNDSHRYTNSVFYEGLAWPTSYSDIDKQIIKILYSDRIRPSMSKGAVKQTIQHYDLTN